MAAAEAPLNRLLPHCSRLGYGCMGIGGDWESGTLTDANREQAFAALDAAVETGITLFDHADIYRRGSSEQVFGEWLTARPGLREKLVIQSKGGICLPDGAMPGHYNADPAYLADVIAGSLARLGIEHLDLWLLHRPDPLWEPQALADYLLSLKEQGLVTHVGVSNMHLHQLQLLANALGTAPVVNQLQLSLGHHDWLDADVEFNTDGGVQGAGTLDYCRRHDIQLQAWGSLAGGRYTADPNGGPAAALVAEMARDRQCSPEAIVLAWLLRHPAGIKPLVGSSQPERISACSQATGVNLSRDDWYRLYIAARERPLP
ncbi:MAG: aldo/keto reductase [Halieaceae bacterium]|jgi:predicted oxidoreductase|nr:aldo/keto reductase [Halieaceae bacterium]